MNDVYGEACFSQNRLNMGLLLWAQVKKTTQGVETHWIISKEKVPGRAISKEGHSDKSSGTWKDTSLLISLKKVQ